MFVLVYEQNLSGNSAPKRELTAEESCDEFLLTYKIVDMFGKTMEKKAQVPCIFIYTGRNLKRITL